MTGSSTPETPHWRKSTYSGDEVNCLELATLRDGFIAMRNSNDPNQVPSVFTREEVEAFFLGVKAGEFDDLL
ncbi:MAG: DUF397 domain-containing protein [Acidimicrobiales bacterium]